MVPTEILSRVSLFERLSSDEISQVIDYLDIISLQTDDKLFSEGDKGDALFVVLEGALEVAKSSFSGDIIRMATVKAGQTIGEMAIIDSLSRSASAIASENTKVAKLSREGFDKLVADKPEIGISVLKGLARTLSLNLRRTSNQLADTLLPLG